MSALEGTGGSKVTVPPVTRELSNKRKGRMTDIISGEAIAVIKAGLMAHEGRPLPIRPIFVARAQFERETLPASKILNAALGKLGERWKLRTRAELDAYDAAAKPDIDAYHAAIREPQDRMLAAVDRAIEQVLTILTIEEARRALGAAEMDSYGIRRAVSIRARAALEGK